jgi:hypothetical protein
MISSHLAAAEEDAFFLFFSFDSQNVVSEIHSF